MLAQGQPPRTSTYPDAATGGGAPRICVGPGLRDRPHPCSALVFINWWLSQDGQEAFMSAGGANDHSRRTDVAGPAELAPAPEDVWGDSQPTQKIQDRAVDLAEELLSGG